MRKGSVEAFQGASDLCIKHLALAYLSASLRDQLSLSIYSIAKTRCLLFCLGAITKDSQSGNLLALFLDPFCLAFF